RVAQLVPDAPDSQAALGRIYLSLGKLSLAREHAALALRMSPGGAAARDLMTELDRESRLAPLRTASDWFEMTAYSALLPLTLLVARRSRRSLRRRRSAWTFAMYVVPAFLVLAIAAHSIKGTPWGWFDARVFESVSDAILFLGLGVAFVMALRAEPTEREFDGDVVLALGAHPDDIELGCGGLLLSSRPVARASTASPSRAARRAPTAKARGSWNPEKQPSSSVSTGTGSSTSPTPACRRRF